jgi:energy-coupling factor transport system permease protein
MITSTYIQGNSFFHKADPRIKILFLLFLLITFFLPISLNALLIIFTFLSISGMISLGVRKLIQSLKMILPIIIFVIILTPPFYKDGDVILIIKDLVILTTEALAQTLRLILRFTGITFCFYIFFSTTSISYFILTLEWFKLPFKAALVITIALRYIPSMVVIYNNIHDAHRLRESHNAKRFFWKKLNNIFPTLVSVLIHSIKSIPALSMALELKGVGRSGERTQFNYIQSNNIILQITSSGVIVLLVILTALFF